MRYAGKIGFGQSNEVRPGVWKETITEIDYIGDVNQRTETFMLGDSTIPTYATRTSVSVLSRGFTGNDHSKMRYVTYAGQKWTIKSIVDEPPRVVIYLGEVYRGNA
jgi:hypothetical protein